MKSFGIAVLAFAFATLIIILVLPLLFGSRDSATGGKTTPGLMTEPWRPQGKPGVSTTTQTAGSPSQTAAGLNQA